MAEYIEREAAIAAINKFKGPTRSPAQNDLIWGAVKLVERIPAADVALVRQGRWIENGIGIIVCSECQRAYNLVAIYTHFCPNCGAKMDGGAP